MSSDYIIKTVNIIDSETQNLINTFLSSSSSLMIDVEQFLKENLSIERFKEQNRIIPAPWNPDKYIFYIGKRKPQWSKLLRILKVEAARSEKIRFNCIARSYSDSTLATSVVDKVKLQETTLAEVKKMAN